MKIEINNLTKTTVDKKFFSAVAKKVLIGENRETQVISLAFIGKAEMQKLNKKFRGKNKPTDVLSFNLDNNDYLGEIIICPEVVKEKGEKNIEVFIHGILHLCGYDHERSKKEAEKMEEKERQYLEQLV